jgi:ABC-2 type transport system permease protein
LRSRSRPFVWLVRKEWRELTASRAWWALVALIGPLVGVSFIAAVNTYAEVSTGAGSGCGFVCNPLDGIWAPTFSAYELAAIFLLPFVAIRLVGGDRQTGALTIELQRPMSPFTRMGAKALVLLAGWLVTGVAGLVAAALWLAYGGSAYAPEIAVVAVGHLLNAGITIALAAAAAAITDHPSTAAIATLAVTVGLWIVDFAAAIHGGVWTSVAAYTPSALVASFQHGLVQADIVLIALTLIVAGLGVAALWMRPSVPVAGRARDVVAWAGAAAVVMIGATQVRGSWDASESRRNSFPEADQAALAQVRRPLTVEVHLAPADPRRQELDREALAKLKRAMPHVRVVYVSRTSTGLFEEADPGYGEVWYDLGGRRVMSRVITDEGVMETVLGLAGVIPGAEANGDDEFRGHPLAARPVAAGWVFYGLWPAAVVGVGVIVSRRQV